MEHQHLSETVAKKETVNHLKMDDSKMQHGSNPKMGMEGHDHNMMIANLY